MHHLQHKYRIVFLLAFTLLLINCAGVQKDTTSDRAELQSSLEHMIEGFQGDVGIYARHFKTGQELAIHADDVFPTASMVKVPIMLTLFDRIDQGLLDYDSTLIWSPNLVNYADDGMLSAFRDSSNISLKKVISLMITYSDNLASLWCQKLSGGGVEINKWLDKNGFHQTRMNSRTPDRQDDWEIHGWGQTTPKEMAGLLTLIHENKAVSERASEEMYRYLTRIYWDDEALSAIPRTVQVASKQGAVSQSRSEVLLVNAPGGDYVFCVITNNQEDDSWDDNNEGFVLIREVSALLWSAWGVPQ